MTITAGLSLLVYALVDTNSAGWGSTQTIGLGAIALALIGAFYVIERRQKNPLVPFPGIFRIRTITGINVSAVLIAAALFSMFFFISLYMQNVLGFSPLKTGLAYLPLAGGIIVAAGAAAPLVTRFGFKPVLVTGLTITAGGLVWFSQVSPDGTFVGDVLFPSLLAAVGLGLAFVSMTVAAVSGVETHETGLASGLINTSQQIGGALGLAILATVANSRIDDLAAAGTRDAGRAHGGLPARLPRRRRPRHRRRGPGDGAGVEQGVACARRSRSARRARAGSRRRLTRKGV